MTNNYFIFRIKEDKTQYLTHQMNWSNNKADAKLMSEQEASDNCNEYSDSEWTAGCGSLS